LKRRIATLKAVPLHAKWATGLDGPTAAALVVWALNTERDQLSTSVMVVANGITKSALAKLMIVQFLVLTQNSPSGVLAQFLAWLRVMLLK